MARVVVTDGNTRAALAVVRSLGRAGHRVFVCADRIPSLAGSSRWAEAEARLADPLRSPQRFLEELAGRVGEWRGEVLLPMSDEALLAVLPERARFAGVRLPFPDARVHRRASDKFALLETAREVGIPVPQQWVAEGPEAARRDDLGFLPYPLVVKPCRSVAGEGAGRVKLRVRYAGDPEGVRACLRDLPRDAYPVLLQRRVEGEGQGIFLMLWDDEVRAVFAHRRLREKPPSGGVSVYRESVRPDPDLVERAAALLRKLGWQGVAMVEFKRERDSGVPYLMEVNGRFWGSLQLAVDAGVDFPALLVRAALGETVPPPPPFEPGVRLRWIWGEVDHIVARLRESNGADGAAATNGAGRWAAVREVVGSWTPGERWETFRLSDPRPFFRESLEWMRGR